MEIFSKIANYLKDAKFEFKKVNWPTKNELIRHTLFVIGISLAVAIFLGGLDYIFSYLLNKFIF